jgi:hypothetical protein
MSALDDFLKVIPVIDDAKNYWFFRTDGGRLFVPFLGQDIIALNYAEIPDQKVKWLIEKEISEAKIAFVNEKRPDHKRPSLIISNLKRFYDEIKIGDVVLIPEVGGRSIAVGEIRGEVENIEGVKKVHADGKIYIDNKYRRARKVVWKVKENKHFISHHLYSLLNAHQTISDANMYAEWINNILYTVYKQGDKYHYVMNIGQRYGLTGKTLYGFFYDLLAITDRFLEDEKIEANTDSTETKITESSQGFASFVDTSGYVIAAIALFTLFINGGTLKIDFKNFKLNLDTKGFIIRINEFLNSSKDRKIKDSLNQKIKALEIKRSNDIVDLITSANRNNQNGEDNETGN